MIGQQRICRDPIAEDLVALQKRRSSISILRPHGWRHQKKSERKTARTHEISIFHGGMESQNSPRPVDQIATFKEVITRYRTNQGLK